VPGGVTSKTAFSGLHDASTSQFKVQKRKAKPIGTAKLGQMQKDH
jgi:hypothetical protein